MIKTLGSALVFALLCLTLLAEAIGAPAKPAEATPIAPKGYKVSVFATAPNARQMALSASGKLYVGSMEEGKVYQIENGQTKTLLNDLNHPSGLLWHNGDLFIAEINRFSVARSVDTTTAKLTPLKNDWPSDYQNGWKYLALGPDGKVYFPIGAPCNVCPTKIPHGTINRMDLDGKNMEVMAEGVRNPLGLAFNQKGELWFTDQNRDQMGDRLPPAELNVLKPRAHYGFPYLHASVKDPYYSTQMPQKLEMTPPLSEFPAHSAPGPLLFTQGSFLASAYPGCVLVSLQGPWNKTITPGFQVTVGCPGKKGALTWRPFLTGFQKKGVILGRPYDLLFHPKGLLVSDDHAGKIWLVEKAK